MENLRMVLFALLAGIVFFLYQAWQEDYATPASAQAPAPARALPDAESQSQDEGVPELGASTASTPQVDAESAAAEETGDEYVEVVTDLYRLQINLNGGDIQFLQLLKYPLTKDSPDEPLLLLNNQPPQFFVMQSGLVGDAGQAPDHRARYSADRRRYTMAPGADRLEVPLRWTGEDGLSVEKVYVFRRGSKDDAEQERSGYQIDLLYRLLNQGDQARVISPYARMWRTSHKAGGEPPFIQSFIGAAMYLRDSDGSYKYKKYDESDLAKETVSTQQQGGWIGMLQHYFVAAILPPPQQTNTFNLRPAKRFGFIAEYVGERAEVASEAGLELKLPLYIGPKLQHDLEAIAPGLQLTVDYGLLTPIAEPLFWVLDKLHGLTGNWGWSIILLTLLIKLAFYKLSEAQYRSMARMKKFAPRIQSIKERYADDRERLHQAMMDLYKKEGFNPLAGCWPMLVQFPVFIALYWVLLESVELRQADFLWWLNDLSSPDPYYVLPVLFGISMFLQQKLSGQAMTMEPMQQRIMNIMPIGLTFFFAFFPAGLVLYWFVSNIIGIAQQWVITRRLEREDETAAKKR